MSVFIYSPGIQCLIATKDGIVDVSNDISSGQVQLSENSSSSMNLVLINKRRKYDNLFTPNDRFVIYMKRVRKLLVLTGYLNLVPYFTVWPRSIQIGGLGTTKRLLMHWWDQGTLDAYKLMVSSGNDTSATVDGGLSQKAVALATQVGGWDPQQIHVGQIPANWLSKVTGLYNAIAPQIATNFSVLGGGTSTAGSTPVDPAVVTSKRDDAPDGGAQLPTTFGVAVVLPTGINYDVQPPTSDYFCALQWGFNISTAGFDTAADKAWLAQRKIMVVNPNTNNGVLCQVVASGPPANSGANVGLSQAAYDALNLDATASEVQVVFMLPDTEGPANLGPYNAQTQNNAKLKVILSHTGDGIGTTNPGNPQALVVTQATGAVAAVNYAVAQVGKPYGWGAGRPINGSNYSSYDCSGLVANAWFYAAKEDIGDATSSQIANPVLQDIPLTSIQPGDLIYYGSSASNPDHVVMAIGGGQVVEAPHTGAFVQVVHLYTDGMVAVKRVSNAPAASGTISATLGGAPIAGTVATSTAPQLLTIYDWYGQGPDPVSEILSGPRALMNDTPLLPFLTMVINASMRSWGQAPNGDLIMYFPDYFGAYGLAGKMQVADVEVQDFVVYRSDDNLVTHQFTAGTWQPDPTAPTPGGPVGYTQMFTTNGIATVEFPQILQALFNLRADDADPKKILDRFGARPNFKAMGTIMGPVAEFWYALYLFQMNWASQFNAQVPITFMPELYPGMLLQIPSQGFQAYVQQVTHTFDLSGGGFQTSASIIAPSAMNGSGLWGLPIGGLNAIV